MAGGGGGKIGQIDTCIRSKLSKLPNLDDYEIDENYVQAINSKYMDQLNFNKLTSTLSKSLSLMHVNIRRLSKHIDEQYY